MTLTDIANQAIESLCDRAISSIEDKEDATSAYLNRRMFRTIREVQSSYKWSCLVKTAALLKTETLPTGECAFLIPDNFLSVIDACPNIAWNIEGKRLVAPVNEICIKYVKFSENPDEWDANLTGAIVSQLKSDVALRITGDTKLAQLAFQEAKIEVPRFARNDSRNRQNRHIPYRSTMFNGW